MLRIRPFAALRPVPNKAARLASVPYDVVDTAESRELASDNDLSFLHVVRSEIDLPASTDPYDNRVYETARANLEQFVRDGVLVREDRPVMYLYRQVINHQSQVGLVCCCHVDDYHNDVIRKHEKTRPDKEDDRTRHVLALNANAEPVFLTYRDMPSIDALMQRDMNERPLFHFNAPDGVTHTVWTVEDPDRYTEAFEAVDVAYIADGHHRSASAARASAERREANPAHTGKEEYNWFLTVLFPHNQLRILAYNRAVKDLNGLSPEDFLEKLAAAGALWRDSGETTPKQAGRVCVYANGAWHTLQFDAASIDRTDPIESLDVSLLQNRVLTPILDIGDPRTDKRIEFIGGIRGAEALQSRVDRGDAAVAFSMYPTSVEQLLAVADAGMVMPPKSTWFEPKLRSGLFVHTLDDSVATASAVESGAAGHR